LDEQLLLADNGAQPRLTGTSKTERMLTTNPLKSIGDRPMKLHRTFLAAALVALPFVQPAAAQDHTPPSPHLPASMDWAPAPPVLPEGAAIAVLSGNPFAEGWFVLRLRLPAGYVVPPHIHSGAELITVISGEFNVGHGVEMDREATAFLPAGSFVEMPAGHPHFAWTGAETVVQIYGPGPFDITYMNPSDNPLGQ
jgi:quercetin dioxygenase-like cupin family protein